MSELIGVYCRRIELLEERIAALSKERDELKAENKRLNKENFEQSVLIEVQRREMSET